MKLLVQSLVKFSSVILILVTKTTRIRNFSPIFKNSKTLIKVEKMDSEK